MPARDKAILGAPCWTDLMTSDIAASREFYGAVFGWTAEEPNEELGGYFNFRKDGVRIAGGGLAVDDSRRVDRDIGAADAPPVPRD